MQFMKNPLACMGWLTRITLLCLVLPVSPTWSQSRVDMNPQADVTTEDQAVLAWMKQAHQLESERKFVEAADVWNQAAIALEKTYGQQAWQVTNARLAHQVALQQSRFGDQQLAEVEALQQLQQAVFTAAQQGDLDSVLPQMQQLESSTARLFGDQSHMLAQIKARTASFQEQQGQLQQAWQTYRDALSIARRSFGPQHPDTEVLYYNLGLMLHRHGDRPRALDHLQQAVNISKHVYGTDHIQYADRVATLGVAFQTTGQYQRALQNLLAAEKIQQLALGADHQRRGMTLKDIGVTYLSMREANQAERFLLAASRIFDRQLGAQDAYSLKTKSQLATALAMNGKRDQAEQVLDSVLAGNRITHGPNSEVTATSEFQLGILKGKRGDYESAEPLLRNALQSQVAQLGPENRATQRTAAARCSCWSVPSEWMRLNRSGKCWLWAPPPPVNPVALPDNRSAAPLILPAACRFLAPDRIRPIEYARSNTQGFAAGLKSPAVAVGSRRLVPDT